MEWLNRLVSEPYYLSHFLAFFSYFIVRSSAAGVLSPNMIDYLFYREIQATLAFAVLVAVKGCPFNAVFGNGRRNGRNCARLTQTTWSNFDWLLAVLIYKFPMTTSHKIAEIQIVREEAWEEFIANTLFYAKVLLVAMTLLIDYHLALWYMVVFLVIYILTQQPAFQKLGTSSKLTPLQLEALLTEGKTSRYWLVEFRAQCSSTCVRASRCFPELSITYSNKILSFGIVDLGLFPNAAEKFGISLDRSLGQLPTYILFESAAEINRFPEFSFEEKLSHPPITKRLLAQHFQLDRLLIEYVNGD